MALPLILALTLNAVAFPCQTRAGLLNMAKNQCGWKTIGHPHEMAVKGLHMYENSYVFAPKSGDAQITVNFRNGVVVYENLDFGQEVQRGHPMGVLASYADLQQRTRRAVRCDAILSKDFAGAKRQHSPDDRSGRIGFGELFKYDVSRFGAVGISPKDPSVCYRY